MMGAQWEWQGQWGWAGRPPATGGRAAMHDGNGVFSLAMAVGQEESLKLMMVSSQLMKSEGNKHGETDSYLLPRAFQMVRQTGRSGPRGHLQSWACGPVSPGSGLVPLARLWSAKPLLMKYQISVRKQERNVHSSCTLAHTRYLHILYCMYIFRLRTQQVREFVGKFCAVKF